MLDGARRSRQAPALPATARRRYRDRDPDNRSGEIAPVPGLGERYRSPGGTRRPTQCRPQRGREPGVCSPRSRIPGPGNPQIALRLDLVEYPGAPAGADGSRSRRGAGPGRTGGIVGIIAPPGADRARPASRPRHRARTPIGDRRVVDAGSAGASQIKVTEWDRRDITVWPKAKPDELQERKTFPTAETTDALPTDPAQETLHKGRGFPNGEFRYRQARGHRAPSARHRPVPAGANWRRPPRPSSTGSKR